MQLNKQLILFRYIFRQFGFDEFGTLREEFNSKNAGLSTTEYLETNINFTGKRKQKALNNWNNYFQSIEKQMQYSRFSDEELSQGNGCVESAIRKVINLRLKSCGSFWKRENADWIEPCQTFH